MKKYIVSIIGVAMMAYSLQAHAGYAVVFSFVSERTAVAPESDFSVTLAVHASFPVNAYEIAFTYTKDLLELVGFDNSNSIIDIWQGEPVIYEDGRVVLKGGSLNAFSGSEGKVIAVKFRAKKEGKAVLAFKTANAYLANGKGTKAEAGADNMEISIQNNAPRVAEKFFSDTTPPQITYLAFVDDVFNPSQKLLGFFVRDDQSGVRETDARYREGVLWSDWVAVRNPVSLRQGVWQVEFKVTDNQGNVRKADLYDSKAFGRVALPWLGIGLLSIVFLLGYKYLGKRKARMV